MIENIVSFNSFVRYMPPCNVIGDCFLSSPTDSKFLRQRIIRASVLCTNIWTHQSARNISVWWTSLSIENIQLNKRILLCGLDWIATKDAALSSMYTNSLIIFISDSSGALMDYVIFMNKFTAIKYLNWFYFTTHGSIGSCKELIL